jgi:Zn-finger nucleic acid-binding protein
MVARDADVVRCSACGATREAGALSCAYCGSDFTIHEQDLDTICPTCMARIGDRARFCHHCATPIAAEEVAGSATDRSCPACGTSHLLTSRSLGQAGLSVLECGRCAGLWLGEEVFEILRERALKEGDPAPDPTGVRAGAGPRPSRGVGPLYRKCPVCASVMNRVNFGRRSGVIVDRCRDHGTWFDAAELDAVLRWLRRGGESLSRERDQDEQRMAASAARFRVEPKVPEDAWRADRVEADAFGSLPWILTTLFDR